MINHWFTKIYLKKIFASAAILLLFFTLTSCTDNGCIDADDFGEYESDTLTVPANFSQSACTYDSTKEIDDTSQGSAVRSCFINGNTTITAENGHTATGTTGCVGLVTTSATSIAVFQNLCISNCVQNCLTNAGGNSGSSEPDWVATSKKISGRNKGVTIKPGSEISIKAIGSITLGDSIIYPSAFINPTEPLPHTKNTSWVNNFIDVKSGQSMDIKFSGQFSNGDGTAYSTIGAGSDAAAVSSPTNNYKVFNASKRAVAFLIPHPTGYDFDTSQTTEEAGSKHVPLLPDARAWQCTYTGSTASDTKNATCDNKANGYSAIYSDPSISNTLSASAFPLSSAFQTTTLSTYGGMIRWTGDGLEAQNLFDPFASVSCTGAASCPGLDGVSGSQGQVIGDASTGDVIFTNKNTDAYKVTFKSLLSDNSCNIGIQVAIQNNSGTVLYPAVTISVSNTGWSTDSITVEPTQKLVITSFSNLTTGGVNCGRVIAFSLNKYHDITILQSGFVKFTMISGSGACTFKGRIINPTGSHTNNTSVTPNLTADFYEYDPFTTTPSSDPLSQLSIPASTDSVLAWSNKIFVRKGQVIRFSPESWNGTWTTTNSLSRQCGIGAAMIIEPRPALLCRGRATDIVNNPLCTPDYNNSGGLIGCRATSPTCTTTSPITSYCPITACQHAITCTGIVSAPYFQKSSCTIAAAVNTPADCTYPTGGSTYTAATCNSCATDMKNAAILPAKIDASNVDQCYDLENYTGKVANIPLTTGFTATQLSNAAVAKGAVNIANFNGNYGNFQGFTPTGTTDTANANVIFQLKSPLTFVKNGRLKFLFLDGSDFNGADGAISAYSNNSASGTAYSGTNGLKVALSGNLSFNNGEWLQVRLCQETSNDNNNPSSACSSDTTPISLADTPEIINIIPPTASTPAGSSPNITGNYTFDSSGNILRTTSSGTDDCTLPDNLVAMAPGANYYCHKYEYFAPATLKAKATSEQTTISDNIQKLRLTFKILDPEVRNCSTTSPTSANYDGIKITNPFYKSSCASNETPAQCNATTISGYTNHTCDPTSEQPVSTGNLTANHTQCLKQFYCANVYSNNTGSYTVKVKVKNTASKDVSSIIGGVITPIIEVMDGTKRNCSTTGSQLSNNGTITDNSLYNSAVVANVGATCAFNEDLTLCQKQFYCKLAAVGQSERIYKLLIADPRYQAILSMCFVIMFTFWGLGYLMGVSDLNQHELVNRVLKISVIYLFASETGWEWFNHIVVQFFKDGTDYIAFMMASSFDSSPEVANAIHNSDYYDKSILFSSVDRVFNMFFSQAVQKKVSALLFASIFGWAYLLIIYSSFMLYVYAVANAVLLYLTAQVFISILFTLGPIFFIFTLFTQTKGMFDAWVTQLIGFSLQQVFLLTTLAFFNQLMYEVIKMALGYKICWGDVWTINIITRVTLLSFWSISSLPPRTNAQSAVGNIGNPDGIPSLFSILFIWVIASLMGKFITFMTDLAASMAGGLSASALGKEVGAAVAGIKGLADKAAGGLWDKTGGEAVKRLDHKLFDSGANAEKARGEREAQNAKDLKNKGALSKAGDNAVSNYKKNNALELAGMSKDEQRQKLLDVKKQGIADKGKELGLGPEEVKRLENDKGLKYEGNNLFGAAFQAATQAGSRGGSLSNSISDKDVKTKFSHDEAQAAMKKMDKGQREKFIDAAEKGKIEVGRSREDKVISAVKNNPKRAAAALLTGGTTEIAIAAGKGLKKGAKAVGKHFYDKNYDKAAKELEKEGKIAKMATGTGWARKDGEKKLIRERQKDNAAKAKVNVKGASPDALVQLKRQDAHMDNKEKARDAGEVGVIAGVKGAKEDAKRALPRIFSKEGRAMHNEAQAKAVAGGKERIGAELADAKKTKSDLGAKRDGAEKVLKTASEALSKTPEMQAIKKKEEEVKASPSKKGQKELQNLKNAAAKNPEFAGASKAIKQASAAINQIDSQDANNDKKIAKLERAAQPKAAAHEAAANKAATDIKPGVEKRSEMKTERAKLMKAKADPAATPQEKKAAKKGIDKLNKDIKGSLDDDKKALKAKGAVSKSDEIIDKARVDFAGAEEGSKKYKKAEKTMSDYDQIQKDYEKNKQDGNPEADDLAVKAFEKFAEKHGKGSNSASEIDEAEGKALEAEKQAPAAIEVDLDADEASPPPPPPPPGPPKP